MKQEIILINSTESRIFTIRGQKVIIDRDLAELYDVKTFVLNQAVKRNINRFPEEFMFKLTKTELSELITNCDKFKNLKHTPSTPYAFTEYGVAMISSVLKNPKAVEINIEIIKSFIKLRKYSLEHKDLSEKLSELEKYFTEHTNNTNIKFNKINQAINYLLDITKPAKIGFKTQN